MAVKLRPILVVGVGLSFSLWLLQSWHQSAELGEFSVLGLIAVGTGLWLFQQQASQNAQLRQTLPLRSDNGGKSDRTGRKHG